MMVLPRSSTAGTPTTPASLDMPLSFDATVPIEGLKLG